MPLIRINLTVIGLLIGILILTAGWPNAVTSHAQTQDSQLSCLKFGECELITCNPDGSYTYTFAVTNQSAFAATQAEFRFVTPSGTTLNPTPYSLTPPLPPNSTRQITVTIGPGVPAGTTVCFTLSVHDKDDLNCCSGLKKCITLPACGAPTQQACATGSCCGAAPNFHDQKFLPFVGKRLAVTTAAPTIPTQTGLNWAGVSYSSIQSEAVVRIFDLTETASFIPNKFDIAPPVYYGPGNQWTHSRLGTVFGIALDRFGNIFVTATSAYNGDSYPNPTGGPWPSGTIWRLDGGTGGVSVYAQLPNFSDPMLAGIFPNNPNETFPALGDIAYDCRFDQFFVTNLEDGKIYRLKSATLNNMTASNANTTTFDPFGADPGNHGFAPLGERLVAVEVHNNRVYYSVWKEDCGNPSAVNNNEIWSVGLDATGNFVPGDNRPELPLPPLGGQAGPNYFSNPVFDISFSREGNMLLSERTMHCDPLSTASRTPPNAKCYPGPVLPYAASTLSAAHASRVLEYICSGVTNNWTLSSRYNYLLTPSSSVTLPYRFNVGNLVNDPLQCLLAVPFQPANAAGGVDYDYSNGPKYTVWVTGDSLLPYLPQTPVSVLIPYGLQGFLPSGGGMNMMNGLAHDAIAIDLNGIMLPYPNQFSDKAQIGDVEIVCPPGGLPQ